MRKIPLKCLGCNLYIYRSKEWKAFYRKYSDEYDIVLNKGDLAITTGHATIFIDTKLDTVAHEVSHLVDWVLFDWLGCEENIPELRAYLTGYLTQVVLDYLGS